jgi:hypothetical protein
VSVIGRDGMENCPTCGSTVCVVMDDEHEGTAHYEPVGQTQVERLREQLAGAVDLLREIAESDTVDNALDPDRNRRIAREFIASLTTPGGQL